MDFGHFPKWLLRFIKRPPQIAYAVGLGRLLGHFVLLPTTRGRKSGQPRVTPLQYEELDGVVYVGSARGTEADWVRNICADPHVKLQAKNCCFDAVGEVSTDTRCMPDFLELRLKRHPWLMPAMLQAEGLTAKPSRQQLEQYAAKRALVVIR